VENANYDDPVARAAAFISLRCEEHLLSIHPDGKRGWRLKALDTRLQPAQREDATGHERLEWNDALSQAKKAAAEIKNAIEPRIASLIQLSFHVETDRRSGKSDVEAMLDYIPLRLLTRSEPAFRDIAERTRAMAESIDVEALTERRGASTRSCIADVFVGTDSTRRNPLDPCFVSAIPERLAETHFLERLAVLAFLSGCSSDATFIDNVRFEGPRIRKAERRQFGNFHWKEIFDADSVIRRRLLNFEEALRRMRTG
jgi:hypothetical protein